MNRTNESYERVTVEVCFSFFKQQAKIKIKLKIKRVPIDDDSIIVPIENLLAIINYY